MESRENHLPCRIDSFQIENLLIRLEYGCETFAAIDMSIASTRVASHSIFFIEEVMRETVEKLRHAFFLETPTENLPIVAENKS